MLTENQEAVLSFMLEFQQREGIPPSTRQIAQQFGFQSRKRPAGDLVDGM